MLRYQQVFAPILGFLALWYSVVNGAFGTALSGAQMEVVKLLPLWALVSFGAYSLASISISLLSVRDCPEASEELNKQLEEAKKDLTAKGFNFKAGEKSE